MKKLVVLLIAVISFSFSSKAQVQNKKTYTFNLDECINFAYANQTDVLNAGIDVDIAVSKVRETIGIGLPQVTAILNFQDFLKQPTTLLPGEFFGQPSGTTVPVKFGTKFNAVYGLEATQLIFDGNYLVGLQASATFKELSNKILQRTKIETAVAVSKAYYSVIVNTERLTLLDANVDRLSKVLTETEALFKNGFVEKIDVDRIKVLYNNLITEREKAQRFAALGIDLLKFQMGMNIDDELILKETANDLTFEPLADLGIDVNPNDRIEYSVFNTVFELNKLELKREKVTFLPAISGFANTNKSLQTDEFNSLFNGDASSFPTTVIGLRVTLPLVGGFQKQQRIKQARLAVEKSKNDLFKLESSIKLDVSNAATNYITSVQSLRNQKQNIELANEIYRISKIKFDEGVGSSLEVTTAETSLKEAQNNYLSSLFDALIAKTDLLKATGKIN